MRALKNLKKDALKLKQKVEIALFLQQASEEEFRNNPCKESWEELEKAELEYKRIYTEYDGCLSCIRNYDFYRECERQEREMEERRLLFTQYR